MRRLLFIFLFPILASAQFIPTAYVGGGWLFKRAVTITNAGSGLTNYQILVTLNSGNMTFSHAKADGSDLRVFASDEVTQLPYWIEKWDSVGQTARIWVNVPSIPNGSTTIYLVYDNPLANGATNGTNTFLFFDDFSQVDASTLNGYYQESALNTPTLGASQGWEGSDAPHFISIMTNPFGGNIDGTNYTYWAWYGLHASGSGANLSGIGLMGSNDLSTWHKLSTNPVITTATGCRSPSVIKVSTTLHMACEGTGANPNQIKYFTSTDGITWTAQTSFTSGAKNAGTPQLWLNPNDNKYYLLYTLQNVSVGDEDNKILVRSAATVSGLGAASDSTILYDNNLVLANISPPPATYAPQITYDSSSSKYILAVETLPEQTTTGITGDTHWQVNYMSASSITGPYTMLAGDPYHTGGYACPDFFVVSGTLYTYYCYNNGTSWLMRYTTATVANGFQQFSKPNSALWTDVHDSSDQVFPAWYITSCTDWKGATAKCLYGNGRYSGINNKQPMLQSSYVCTDCVLDGQVFGIDGNLASIGHRMSATAGNEYADEVYFNHNGTFNFYIDKLNPTFNSVANVAAANQFWSTWYQVEAQPHGTTQAASVNFGASSASGTDATYASGPVGATTVIFGSSEFGYLFVRQYTGTVPTNSVGGETSFP